MNLYEEWQKATRTWRPRLLLGLVLYPLCIMGLYKALPQTPILLLYLMAVGLDAVIVIIIAMLRRPKP